MIIPHGSLRAWRLAFIQEVVLQGQILLNGQQSQDSFKEKSENRTDMTQSLTGEASEKDGNSGSEGEKQEEQGQGSKIKEDLASRKKPATKGKETKRAAIEGEKQKEGKQETDATGEKARLKANVMPNPVR